MTTVVDASCLADYVTRSGSSALVRRRFEHDPALVAPHLIDVEVFGSIRRRYLRGEIDGSAAAQAMVTLEDWTGQRLGHTMLLARAWELRDSVSAPDAIYIALAETLDAPLITLDARLARADGLRCEIEVLGA